MTFARMMVAHWVMANWTVFAWFAPDMERGLTFEMVALQCLRLSRFRATWCRKKMVG
jgi:hypothetical protein